MFVDVLGSRFSAGLAWFVIMENGKLKIRLDGCWLCSDGLWNGRVRASEGWDGMGCWLGYVVSGG